MYKLALTREERKALDWIGYRYFHGNELYDLLTECDMQEVEWDSDQTITFSIPENIAWSIKQGFDCENNEFACLDDWLANKLRTFAS